MDRGRSSTRALRIRKIDRHLKIHEIENHQLLLILPSWKRDHFPPGAPICRVVRKGHEHGRTTECMNWPAQSEEPAVRTTILDNTAAAKSAAQHWAREKEAKIGAGVSMWWTDGSRSDDGRVGPAAVCKLGNEWRSRRSFLRTGHMEVFNAELWAIRLALDVVIEKREPLQAHGLKTLAVCSDSQAAIR